jgi:hypothetical protein
MAKELPVIQPGLRQPGLPPIFGRSGSSARLIGGSIALRAASLAGRLVIGVDRDVLETAMRLHAIDAPPTTSSSWPRRISSSRGAGQAEHALSRSSRRTSTPPRSSPTPAAQREIHAAAALPPRFTFIGGHPLAAPHSGLEHARPDLSPAAPGCSLPVAKVSRATVAKRWRSPTSCSFVGRSARAADRDGQAHDRLLAFLSHLPQLTASALMQVVGDAVALEGWPSPDGPRRHDPLAASPADIWRDIAGTNADEIARARRAHRVCRSCGAIFRTAIG